MKISEAKHNTQIDIQKTLSPKILCPYHKMIFLIVIYVLVVGSLAVSQCQWTYRTLSFFMRNRTELAGKQMVSGEAFSKVSSD